MTEKGTTEAQEACSSTVPDTVEETTGLDTAALNQVLPCLSIDSNVVGITLIQEKEPVSFDEYSKLVYAGGAACQPTEAGVFYLNNTSTGRAFFKLINWRLPEFESCVDSLNLNKISNDKLNVLNLVNVVYEAYMLNFARTVEPSDKIRLFKHLIPIRYLTDFGDSSCQKGRVGLDIGDVKLMIENEPLKCDITPASIKVSEKKMGQIRTLESQLHALRFRSVHITAVINTPNKGKLPTIHLRFPLRIYASVRHDKTLTIAKWQSSNLGEPEDDNSEENKLKSLYYAFPVKASDLTYDHDGNSETEEIALRFDLCYFRDNDGGVESGTEARAEAKMRVIMADALASGKIGLVALRLAEPAASGDKAEYSLYDLDPSAQTISALAEGTERLFFAPVSSPGVRPKADGTIEKTGEDSTKLVESLFTLILDS
jgi:hypothetical protein